MVCLCLRVKGQYVFNAGSEFTKGCAFCEKMEKEKQKEPLFVNVGVDVGTGSVRAGLFSYRGRLLNHCKQNIRTWRDESGHSEQSTDDIWAAVVSTVKVVVQLISSERSIIGRPLTVYCRRCAIYMYKQAERNHMPYLFFLLLIK